MIEVLYFADKAVTQKLIDRVAASRKLTLVTVLPPHRCGPHPQGLEPFATLERDFSAALDQVLVVDEGKVEGMWRDPMTDLADRLFPDDAKGAYAAARGYLLVRDGAPVLTLKKTPDHEADLHALEREIEKLSLRRKAGGAPRARAAQAGPAKTLEELPVPELARAYAVLGLQPGASLEDAKKAWKAMVVKYHPDKVAHLAPEFRTLAENKTREIMAAWEQLQQALGPG
ncbi:MAG: J domain-containing protein [Archangiaceae bacterium]|nr:J domain-containing protein [Archangiaceae bacterium]